MSGTDLEDPKDYRSRYFLPDQFLWERSDWPRIDFDGYMTVVEELLPGPPATILDVGCGPGFGAKRLASLGYSVTGIDFNARAIAFARLLVPECTFAAADLRSGSELSQVAGPFEAAICVEVLEHVPPTDRRPLLKTVQALLAPGASLVLSTPTRRMYANPWDYRRLELEELTTLLMDAGFQVEEVRFQHRLPSPCHPLIWRLISNRVWDLRIARSFLRMLFLRWFNRTNDSDSAGRFVLRALSP
jgi:SAM-dependent methyltransferase